MSILTTRRNALAFGAAAGSAAILSWPIRAQERPTIRVAVGGLPSLYYVVLTLTERLGFFDQEGVKVEYSDFAGGAKALQAVMGRSADVVAAGFDASITMQGMGQDLRCFLQINRTAQMALIAQKAVAARYKSPADLKGLKIGVTAPGSSTHLTISHVLAKANLSDDDVSIVGVGGPASSFAAFTSGNIDVLTQSDPAATMCEQAGGVVIADARTQKGSAEMFGGSLLSTSLSAEASFLDRNKDGIQRMTNAFVRTLRWLPRATAEQVAGTVPEQNLLGNKALYMAAFEKGRDGFTPDGLTSEDGARNTVAVVANFNHKVDPKRIEFSKLYTNEFVQAAALKLG